MRFGSLVRAGVIATALPTGLAAQEKFEGVPPHFEGVITMRTGMTKRNGVENHLYVKGSHVRLERGEAGGAPANTAIWDQEGRVIAIRNAARQYMVLGAATKLGTMKFEPTGRSETVAGYPCNYYKLIDSSGKPRDDAEGCITVELGFINLGPGQFIAADERAPLQFVGGFMVLKVLDHKGATSLEVTKVERRSVSDAMFAPPQGFTEIKLPGAAARPRP